jgi:hypothetical protein
MRKHKKAAMSVPTNRMVQHPDQTMVEMPIGWFFSFNERILAFFSEHFLASMVMFDVALILPLLAIPANNEVKLTLGVISGSWIQWWALHALQRTQLKADEARKAKADVDHEALTHIANRLDAIYTMLNEHRGNPV